jgi:hypothetical protein
LRRRKMLKEAIDKILGLADPKYLDHEGRKYCSKTMGGITPPEPEPLIFGTLSGLASYLNENRDGLDKGSLIVVIDSHDKVSVWSKLDPSWKRRDCFAMAIYKPEDYPFGRWLASEEFMIQLQSKFVKTDKLDAMVRFAGKTKSVNGTDTDDDGVTQTVSQKAGVSLVAEASVPNPVKLQPYRTFSVVQQPEVSLVFRVKQERDGYPPQFALFEADGGHWKLGAIANIRDYLAEKIAPVSVIA